MGRGSHARVPGKATNTSWCSPIPTVDESSSRDEVFWEGVRKEIKHKAEFHPGGLPVVNAPAGSGAQKQTVNQCGVSTKEPPRNPSDGKTAGGKLKRGGKSGRGGKQGGQQ